MNLRWNLGLKLHAAISGLTIFSVLLAGITIYQLASSSAKKMALQTAFSQLEATRSAKAMQIESYFQSISNQMISLSDDLMVIEAVRQFTNATETLPAINASQQQQLEAYYSNDFGRMYNKKAPAARDFEPAHLMQQLDERAIAMQYDYIANNPHPLGKKYLLHAGDNLHHSASDYGRTHQKYHFHFRQIQQHMGYYDLFLIEPEQGRVIYSVFKELDFGTRLSRGPWQDSGLAEAYRGAMQLNSEDKVFLTDMAPYAPSYEAQAIFLSSQIRHEGRLIGILAIQIPIREINTIMTGNYRWQEVGAGNSGESYIIGADLKMRSASRFHHEDEEAFLQSLAQVGVAETTMNHIRSHHSVIGHLKVNTYAARTALSGNSDVVQYDDYRGTPALSAFQPLNIPGQSWALISEIDKAEALAAVYTLQAESKQMIIMIAAILTLLALLFGRWFSRRLMRPMHAVTDQLKALSLGVVGHEKVTYSGQDEISDLVEAGYQLDHRLRHAIDQFKHIGEGDFTQYLDVRSDSDALGQALLQMNQTLRALAHVAATVATGDYSVEVKAKGERDQLGRSLEFMTRSLRQAAKESEAQDWLKSSLNDISREIQGKGRTEDIAVTVMRLLPPMLGATHAAFFIWKEENNHLSLKGHYASSMEALPDRISLGEGLTGQCARDKTVMLIDNVPANYLRIGSSLGSAEPTQLIEVPLLADGALAGVIELASLVGLSDIQQNLLQQLSPVLGMAVLSVQQSRRTEKLLEESQTLTEELQAQEEELREANVTLELRAEELSTSEEKLQTQQEELRLNNEELIERNSIVEAQKSDLQASAESLAKKADQLQQASQYKSDFLSNMSHELRTPLNSLLILSDMLAKNKHGNLTGQQVEFASTIHGSGVDLLNLINDILDLAKVEAGKMMLDAHRFPLHDITDAMQRDFTHVAEKHDVAFRIQHAADLPVSLFSDAMRIKQVLKNLLSNAFKFTAEGEVVLSVVNVDEQQISFTVSDSGTGIAADKLHDIFEAFQQEDGSTSRKHGGTGLGLSICRELAKLLGGHISVQSEQGKGSSFAFILPVTCDSSNTDADITVSPVPQAAISTTIDPAPQTKVQDIPNPMADDRDDIDVTKHTENNRSILIIEDDEKFAAIVQSLVQEHGFKAINALRGDHGLMLAQQYIPAVILLDLQLPVLDGMSVLDRLKQHPKLRHIPVHVISCMDQQTEKRVLQAGAISFVHKPAKKEELDHVLDEISLFLQQDLHRLLIVEDNQTQLNAMCQLLAANDVEVLTASTGSAALELLRDEHVDCMILDLTLPDMAGEEVLETVAMEDGAINQGHLLPIIVHTGKELSEAEVEKLQSMSKSIIVKGSYSPDRLLAETSLFLHQLEQNMSDEKQQSIGKVREQDVDISGKTVLLVDDDIRNIYSLSSYLEGYDLTVHTARNGLEALAALEQYGDDIKLILMDVMMHEMDGHAACREIRKLETHKNLPIIALTAKAMKGDREQCIAAGASDYITKPVDTDKLISLMRVWLHD